MKERDACGIGFVADERGRASRELVDLALEALRRVRHRGAVAADRRTGDGAGLLLPLPRALLPAPWCGLAMVFLREEAARTPIEHACAEEGIETLGWRPVPIVPDALGEYARSTMPRIEQLVLRRPAGSTVEEAELRAFRARKRAERTPGAYLCSLSFRTVTYKALCAASELGAFYSDLLDPVLEVPFAIFHQRFSTNTTPSWERAQPFRLSCHNGEINTIDGNRTWMRARGRALGSEDDDALHPVLDETGSDSAMLDNALEALVRGGRDVRHATTMLVPRAWQRDTELDEEVRAFYRYHACLLEPWDGPAGIVYTDGRVVGARLDRNGLRPLRIARCEDGLVVCASEAGTADLLGRGSVRRGRLGPGEALAVDPAGSGVETTSALERRLARRKPYRRWLKRHLVLADSGSPVAVPASGIERRQVAAGYTREDVTLLLRPAAAAGHEPVSSMGDDTALPPLAGRPRPVTSYFRQRFAQVTNPALDHLRERSAMSLQTLLGARAPLLAERSEAARLIELESFFLFPSALEKLVLHRLDATFDAVESLADACARLAQDACEAVRGGAALLRVVDTPRSDGRAAAPALVSLGAVHQALLRAGLRSRCSLVVDSDEPRESHDFACLLGYGADAICPRLALETVAAMAAADGLGGDRPSPGDAQQRFRASVEDGVLKVMAKMGVADVASYRGAQIFEAIGLASDVLDHCFAGTPAVVGGVGFAELERESRARAEAAETGSQRLESPGYVKFRKGGERHATDPDVVAALHETAAAHALRRAVRGEGTEAYERFAALVNGRRPLELRDLLEPIPALEPIALEEVEPAASIARRFSSGAMSHGALSAEAHETVAVALASIGGRANTGEGGEDPSRYRTNRNSGIKQVASGRFGVTPEYLAFADEIQIKIAQGSKPGEGGQLPGYKVTADIARLRHTQPGISLISPPPHHDIYSIEDLAQLVFDLRQVNPRAEISVKLVSSAGVGIVAAGCVKALADVVHIAGADGGTGASPLSSIKNAGAPWELGLVETQRALADEGLRGRARIRVDGGLKTGRDVLMAALLGADEFSFGTALLLAEGCLMVRSCHLDTCPVGIATQRPELRAKFAATPEMVAAYLLYVAGEVREGLAVAGLRTLDDAVGRADLLRRRTTGDAKADSLVLAPLLAVPGGTLRYSGEPPLSADGGELGARLALDAAAVLTESRLVELSYPIGNRDRTVGARLGGRIARRFGAAAPAGRVRVRLDGTAGQSFGAFLTSGVRLELSGEANDYVGKGMSGGRIVIRPPAGDAGNPVLVGNTALYGATGGELFCAGRAGERFAVRNSGAAAVVEGTGDHSCEYMTGGTVVVLGETGRNVGAGMTGGELWVHDPRLRLPGRVDAGVPAMAQPTLAELAPVRELVERHARTTDSPRATALLGRWDGEVEHWWRVAPAAATALPVEADVAGAALAAGVP
jgi:glutamate synthase domain-containing protein 2/glutamate synthase domain-containing protein 1/glutamate synthase domain-containing protein 3